MNVDELASAFQGCGVADVLKPGMSGDACCNIKIALSALGYRREWSCADRYDEELQSVVRQFQLKLIFYTMSAEVVHSRLVAILKTA